eukprot:g352.t1
MELKQFDRFVESLREQQYAPFEQNLTTCELYKHLGDLWMKNMWSDPPPKMAVAKRAVLAAATNEDSSNPSNAHAHDSPRGPDVPPSKLAMREKFGHADDGRICQTLEGVCLSEDGAKKILCDGAFIITTKIKTNPNTGAPTDWVYTIENKSLRDADITLDFDQSKGVGAVTLEYKEERSNLIHVTVKAKESEVVAWLRPRKKKSIFAWENNSDDEDDMGGGESYLSRKKKKGIVIVANIKITHLHYKDTVGNDLPIHVMTAVNSLRELRRTLTSIEDDTKSIGNIWANLEEFDADAIEWKVLEQSRSSAMTLSVESSALSNAAIALLAELNGPDADSDMETSSEQSQVEVDEGKDTLQSKLVGKCGETSDTESTAEGGGGNGHKALFGVMAALIRPPKLSVEDEDSFDEDGSDSDKDNRSRDKPVIQCRKQSNEPFPLRYDPEWTCRFDPTVDENLPALDGLGFSALHIASFSGECEIAGMLLSAGWDPLARTARGHTPVDLARLMGWEALHHALEEVSEGSSSFYQSLLAYSLSRCSDYTDNIEDVAKKGMLAWTQINNLYLEEKKRKEEAEKRAEDNGRGTQRNKKKKKKKTRKKKEKKLPPIKASTY